MDLELSLIRIMVCYARADEHFLKKLKESLPLLASLTISYTREISQVMDSRAMELGLELGLETAQLVLLLVSPDFLDSGYCYGVEMRLLIKRHNRGETRVIPVILYPTAWQATPFGKLPVLPVGGEPIVSSQKWSVDEAFLSLRDGIHQVMKMPLVKVEGMEPVEAVKVFYCYARRDRRLREELASHLESLRRLGQITVWYDREIPPGVDWKREIDRHLNTSNIILLLVSPNFMRSDYCYGVEMQRALERHRAGEAHVIPIILRPVDWKETPIGELQALPTDAKPIIMWRNRDEAFEDVAKGVRKVVESLLLLDMS